MQKINAKLSPHRNAINGNNGRNNVAWHESHPTFRHTDLAFSGKRMQKVMQRGVVAANVAPGVTPPFLSDLRKIPHFRRGIIRYDNKTAKSIHIHDEPLMATPIKDTPVLTGKDARNFDQWIKDNEGKKISREEYQRIQDAGKKFQFEVQPGVACGGCVEP